MCLIFLRSPLPDPVICGKFAANELDRKRHVVRKKHLKDVVSRCEKLASLELRTILDEMELIVGILEKIEKEVIIFSFKGQENTPHKKIFPTIIEISAITAN